MVAGWYLKPAPRLTWDHPNAEPAKNMLAAIRNRFRVRGVSKKLTSIPV